MPAWLSTLFAFAIWLFLVTIFALIIQISFHLPMFWEATETILPRLFPAWLII